MAHAIRLPPAKRQTALADRRVGVGSRAGRLSPSPRPPPTLVLGRTAADGPTRRHQPCPEAARALPDEPTRRRCSHAQRRRRSAALAKCGTQDVSSHPTPQAAPCCPHPRPSMPSQATAMAARPTSAAAAPPSPTAPQCALRSLRTTTPLPTRRPADPEPIPTTNLSRWERSHPHRTTPHPIHSQAASNAHLCEQMQMQMQHSEALLAAQAM